jgi:predicted transcriptional regulator
LRIEAVIAERDHVLEQLARPEISSDPEQMPGLARRLYELNEFYHPVETLKNYWDDLQQLEEMLAGLEDEGEREELITELIRPKTPASVGGGFQRAVKSSMDSANIQRGLNPPLNEVSFKSLHGEYLELCGDLADQVYRWLLDKGHLKEEFEDETDLEILRFIEYAGPEYAWRLSINVNISWEEARERLDNLLNKGLLEKVQGTMLENYHRARDWTKHMNHTYYRLSREGKHYLRRLRNEQLDQQSDP